MFSYLLTLVLVVASVLVANHVHIQVSPADTEVHSHSPAQSFANSVAHTHEHADTDTEISADIKEEQIENCFTYHQFQSHDQALPGLISLKQFSETVANTQITSVYIEAGHVVPPARAPPSIS